MSSPRESARGIMAHSLVALLSLQSQDRLSPVVSIGGDLGILRVALPVLQAHIDAARTTWKTRQAVYSASSWLG